MRQGSVQPLSVTTGWYAGPLDGMSGGCIAGDVVVTASGMAAAWTRPLTAAALARMAEPPIRLRREIMVVVLIDISARLRRAGRQK